MSSAPAKPDTTLAKEEKKLPLLAGIAAQINGYIDSGRLTFPKDYNLGNAMASAKIAMIDLGVVNANGDPTGTVTTTSLVNAIFDMAVQGMNLGKRQGYLIAYGKKLGFQRSYFGDQALVCRVKPGIIPYADFVCPADKFIPYKVMTAYGLVTCVAPVYDKEGKFVKGHELGWPRDVKQIVAAYAGSSMIDEATGEMRDMGCEIMTIDQIHTSWKKSKSIGPNSFHNEQPDQACLRTVIRRWAKPIINSSNDALLMESVKRQDEEAMLAEIEEIQETVDAEIQEHANKEPLSLASEAEAPSASVEGSREPEPAETGTEAQEQPKAQHAPQRRERI